MAIETELLDVLTTFTTATEAVLQGLPNVASLLPPGNGITLLDTKTEIFLSYLQALALRNLNVIRSCKDGVDVVEAQRVSKDITKKLVEHRVYLERGVRPLEQKIKYQVDRVVKVADDDDRAAKQPEKASARTNGKVHDVTDSEVEGGENNSEDEDLDAVRFRPNAAALTSSMSQDANAARRARSKEDGVYRPPRVSATAMPTTEQTERKERKPTRSATVDEYISTELSAAPLAEPSIGSTITAGGRRNKNARQLAQEAERRDYEETNLVRLPKESKKARNKKAGRDRDGGFGGDEWRGLGDSLDRIGDVTKRKSKGTALEKSRKRRDIEDEPRASGIGDAFEVKKRRMMKKTTRQ